ncbi:glycosyltransferase [Actinomadura livida]|uniref:Glycosyltransferase n=1 Tax=Actinomadura livida TaxID=79909 RepID=A0A7W7I884_9ACTN|nr:MULTISPECIES: glycosyltransferase [Actinomadura]MBB4772260.1 glycosyltransferase involved in cell wall biosynthesis [Actinomadura catellatispora]GGU28019.1 glycosyl transferase family 1 [Actinomadura livida]
MAEDGAGDGAEDGAEADAGEGSGGAAPLRVLHVSWPTAGGVAGYVAQVAGDQRRRGWDVAVAAPPGGDLSARCAAAGVPWFRWPAGRAPGPRTLPEALRLRRLVRSFAPDVIHLHSAKAGLAGRLVRRRGTPVIFQPHGWSWLAATGPQVLVSRCWERLAARRSDALICVGNGELEEGRRAGVRGPYRLVRNGVDRRRFAPAGDDARRAARTRLGLPAGAPLAVCVGRLTRQKAQDVLLAAWPDVIERCPNARLAIVGDGEDLGALERQAVPGVLFVPAVADPRPWLAASNVVVLPSRWEGLPLTALEALATGRPLVGTDVPGISEVVRPGLGALVPVEDPAALADQIAVRLLVPGLAEREGREAAAASAAYDVARTLSLLAAVTREVAGLGETPDEALGDVRAVAGGLLGARGEGALGEGVADGSADGAEGREEGGVVGGTGGQVPGVGTAGCAGDGSGAVTPPNSSR